MEKGKHPRKWKRSKGADWTEMRKEEKPKGEDGANMKKETKLLRCTLLNGSAWSTEKKYMRRYKGTFDIFFGIEHRLRKENEGDLEKCLRCAAVLRIIGHVDFLGHPQPPQRTGHGCTVGVNRDPPVWP